MSEQAEQNRQNILALYRDYVRTDKIAEQLGLTRRHVQRVIKHEVGPSRGTGNSADHALKQIRHIVVGILQSQGRNFTRCEICGESIPEGKFDLHHTKYDGATLDDLQIVCRACNLSRINMFLD
jgi:AraC-like DNA-binding protein